jgi:hypothetical protein
MNEILGFSTSEGQRYQHIAVNAGDSRHFMLLPPVNPSSNSCPEIDCLRVISVLQSFFITWAYQPYLVVTSAWAFFFVIPGALQVKEVVQ